MGQAGAVAHGRAMRSRGSCRGKIPPRCVLGRQSVASFALHASRKRPRTGKSPVRGKIRTPCIRKRAGLGRICAPCIRNVPQIAVGGYTARRSCQEGALFAARAPRITHGAQILPSGVDEAPERPQPLCRRPAPNRPRARSPSAAEQHGTARAAHNHAAVRMAAHHPQHSRCQRQPHRKRSHTHRPATLRRQADVKSCAARAPQRQSAARGPTAPQRPMAPSGRSIHNGGGATRLDANPDATGATAPTPSAASSARSAKPPARPTRESAAAFGGTSLCSIESAHPPYIFIRRSCGGVFQLMLQEQLRFPTTQANVEARRALAMAYRTETACHQHLVNAESTAILEHNNARLKAAIPPEPRQHVHRFAVDAPHFAIFRPVVHVCILEQVFV